MRDPNNMISVDINRNSQNIIKLDNIPEFDIEDYDFFDDKSRKKYFKDLERVVRTSFEYRAMINYLRENVGMSQCSFFENVSNIDTYKIKIEIHHEPFDLYTICKVVYNKRCAFDESVAVEDVAKEVMFLHYNMMVGLIPLSETVHELVHSNILFIPTSKVFGCYQGFMERYGPYFDQDDIDLYNDILIASESYDHVKNTQVLNTSFVYIDLTGAWDIPKKEDVISAMRYRIDSIRNDKEAVPALIFYNK